MEEIAFPFLATSGRILAKTHSVQNRNPKKHIHIEDTHTHTLRLGHTGVQTERKKNTHSHTHTKNESHTPTKLEQPNRTGLSPFPSRYWNRRGTKSLQRTEQCNRFHLLRNYGETHHPHTPFSMECWIGCSVNDVEKFVAGNCRTLSSAKQNHHLWIEKKAREKDRESERKKYTRRERPR